MNLGRIGALALLAWGLAVAAQAAPADLTRHVDPFIGTDGTGHVFPGATRPFGMVAPSPDNAAGGWDYSSGYQYRAPRILGFSNTHISGAGIPELGDVLLQPASGTPWSAASTDFASRQDKQRESARPGFYSATLTDHRVRVELTATARVALHRYTFAQAGPAQVLVDLQHGLRFEGESGASPDNRVTRSEVKLDAMAGDATLFARNDEVEHAWRYIDIIGNAWHQSDNPPPMCEYPAGSWGPREADELLGVDGRVWRRI